MTKCADDVGFVYFIQEPGTGAIKIGKAKDAVDRLKSLQTGSSRPLQLLAVVPGYTQRERELHERFAKLRMSGEWFESGAELLVFIEGVRAAGAQDLVAAAAETERLRVRVAELENELSWHRDVERMIGLSHRELVRAVLAERIREVKAEIGATLEQADEAIADALGVEDTGAAKKTGDAPVPTTPARFLVAEIRHLVEFVGDIWGALREWESEPKSGG